jgi:ribosomal protein S18 acetylase RimI-like enzyme
VLPWGWRVYYAQLWMRRPKYPSEIPGDGLVLRPWTMPLVRQMAEWEEHGFPYHAFDLAHLADPMQAAMALARAQEEGKHRHFVACEAGTAVGRVAVNLDDEAGLYLWAVHVPPEHAGRGVARRMLAALMTWLEGEYPGRDFVLTSNGFAENAHRTYRALGFEVAETRWHYDKELAAKLWRVSAKEREPVARYLRFQSGRWQVRAYIFRRKAGAPMLAERAAVAS